MLLTVVAKTYSLFLASLIGTAMRTRRRNWPAGRLTLRELSQRTGLAQTTLSDYECGQCLPSTEALIVLAQELNLDLNALARQAKRWAEQNRVEVSDPTLGPVTSAPTCGPSALRVYPAPPLVSSA